jgi:hypothetical protein
MRRIAVALCHYPVLDAQQAIVTTAITNLDVHDLARSARTYGVSDYFVAHPIAAQRELVNRILTHWSDGSSGRRIPDRKVALEVVRVVSSIDEAVERLGGRASVEIWVTAARDIGAAPLDFAAARARLGADDPRAVLLVFGTGWGLTPEVIASADVALEPVRAALATGYNHLSVRAACAIILDRLLGAR